MSPTSSVFDYFKNSSNSSAASTPTTATTTTTATHSFNRTQGKGFNESTADQLQREQDGQAIAQATTQILTHTTPQQKKKRMIKRLIRK